MNEMVERVARAIFDAMEGSDQHCFIEERDGLKCVCVDGHVDMTAVARAAIAAMREPTNGMAVAFYKPMSSAGASFFDESEFPACWNAAIDAAINQQET